MVGPSAAGSVSPSAINATLAAAEANLLKLLRAFAHSLILRLRHAFPGTGFCEVGRFQVGRRTARVSKNTKPQSTLPRGKQSRAKGATGRDFCRVDQFVNCPSTWLVAVAPEWRRLNDTWTTQIRLRWQGTMASGFDERCRLHFPRQRRRRCEL